MYFIYYFLNAIAVQKYKKKGFKSFRVAVCNCVIGEPLLESSDMQFKTGSINSECQEGFSKDSYM